MPINPALLIAAPVLQDAIIDKTTGLPLYNGKIVLWQDNARTILKNWYYQTGSAGTYTYAALPNPLTLSAAGSIVDINGVDTIPFFYPYSEVDNSTPQPYFIQVFDQYGQLQFTRQNFPFNPSATPGGATVDTNKNLVTNSAFWRNIGSVNATNITASPGFGQYGVVVAPSQHDNFAMPDMQFIKDVNGAVDTITFYNFVNDDNSPTSLPFPDQIINDQITPQYYMNLNCTAAGMETEKYIQIPIQSQVTSLSGVQNCTVTIAAMSVGGNANNEIEIAIYQFLGTGVTSPVPIIVSSFMLSSDFEKYTTVSFPIPSAQDLTLGKGGDDGLYMQIRFQAGVTTNINIAYPTFYLSDKVPTNDWDTYDQINSIISSPRTGDVRTSYNNYLFGYAQMNDGTIGSLISRSTCRSNIDTFPLYNLIWYLCSSDQSLAPMYTSVYQPISYGASPIADFTANNQLSLTKQLGRCLLAGIMPLQSMVISSIDTGTSTITLSSSAWPKFFNNNVPVFVTSTGTVPGGLGANFVYYLSISPIDPAMVKLLFSPNGTLVPITSAGTGTITLTLFGSGDIANYVGEFNHKMTIPELVPHVHSASFSGQFLISTGGVYSVNNTGSTNSFQTDTGPVVGGASALPFNVLSPATFSNFYIKL